MSYLSRESRCISIRVIAVMAAFLLLASCGSGSDSAVAAIADDPTPVVATAEAVATVRRCSAALHLMSALPQPLLA